MMTNANPTHHEVAKLASELVAEGWPTDLAATLAREILEGGEIED